MRDFLILMLLSALGAAPLTVAERVIELKDGGTLLVRTDGNMVHRDAAGRRIQMRDGEPMESLDGLRYAMKNDSSRRQTNPDPALNPSR